MALAPPKFKTFSGVDKAVKVTTTKLNKDTNRPDPSVWHKSPQSAWCRLPGEASGRRLEGPCAQPETGRRANCTFCGLKSRGSLFPNESAPPPSGLSLTVASGRRCLPGGGRCRGQTLGPSGAPRLGPVLAQLGLCIHCVIGAHPPSHPTGAVPGPQAHALPALPPHNGAGAGRGRL